jgi:hypothetical protein
LVSAEIALTNARGVEPEIFVRTLECVSSRAAKEMRSALRTSESAARATLEEKHGKLPSMLDEWMPRSRAWRSVGVA